MPPIKEHIKLSTERTGKPYKRVHEWIDGRDLSHNEKGKRHDIINIPQFLPIVKEKFGEDGAKEYLQHIKDDYEENILFKILKKIKKVKMMIKW